MKRSDFIKTGTMAALVPFCQPLFALGNNKNFPGTDDALIQRMITLNDQLVSGLLETVHMGKLSFGRKPLMIFRYYLLHIASPVLLITKMKGCFEKWRTWPVSCLTRRIQMAQ